MKERYRYQLPSELETNLRTLDRLQTQKTSNIEAIDRYMTMRLNLEQQIAETPAQSAGSCCPSVRLKCSAVSPGQRLWRPFRQKNRNTTSCWPGTRRSTRTSNALRWRLTDEEDLRRRRDVAETRSRTSGPEWCQPSISEPQ